MMRVDYKAFVKRLQMCIRDSVSTYTSALAFADTCVFAKQSLVTILCGLFRGTPSPEVTGSFCRVPSQEFSRPSQDSLLAHLRRFPVRALTLSLAAFLASVNSDASLLFFGPVLSLIHI